MVFECWWTIAVLVFGPIFIFGLLKKNRTCKIIGVIPLALIILIFINIFFKSQLAKSPDWVFKQAFGSSPSERIKILEHKYLFGSEYIEIYLKFETDIDNISEITKVDFSQRDQEEFKHDIFGYEEDSPKWFTPLKDEPTHFYKKYGKYNAILSYNEKSRIAYYHSSQVW